MGIGTTERNKNSVQKEEKREEKRRIGLKGGIEKERSHLFFWRGGGL